MPLTPTPTVCACAQCCVALQVLGKLYFRSDDPHLTRGEVRRIVLCFPAKAQRKLLRNVRYGRYSCGAAVQMLLFRAGCSLCQLHVGR